MVRHSENQKLQDALRDSEEICMAHKSPHRAPLTQLTANDMRTIETTRKASLWPPGAPVNDNGTEDEVGPNARRWAAQGR